MDLKTIRIASLVDDSIVDGPGIRFTIFMQGCPHHCIGCHNPETHDFQGGYLENINNIILKIKNNPLCYGVTISGGEPFAQKNELLELVNEIKKINKNIIIYTGYIYEELIKKDDSVINEILRKIDYLVDGPFILSKRDLTLTFRGSSNQRFIDMNKTRLGNKLITLYNE